MRLHRWRWVNRYLLGALLGVGIYWVAWGGVPMVPSLSFYSVTAIFGLILAFLVVRLWIGIMVSVPTSPRATPVEPTGIVIDDQTPLEIGTKLVAYSGGRWWSAVVIGIADERVIIRYVGWTDSWNEPQPRRNLQLLVPARAPDADKRDGVAPMPEATSIQISQRDKVRPA
ncbi:MAG TPA: hypothetical protein VFE62_22650 [Gemmataceae bacterium]|nr:hypothetical protein [Gemmataceae bacterium]